MSIVGSSQDDIARALSQLKRVIRTNYSNPPTHGGQAVATVLVTPELRQIWEDELAGMRVRIRECLQLIQQTQAESAQQQFRFRHPPKRHVFLFRPDQNR